MLFFLSILQGHIPSCPSTYLVETGAHSTYTRNIELLTIDVNIGPHRLLLHQCPYQPLCLMLLPYLRFKVVKVSRNKAIFLTLQI